MNKLSGHWYRDKAGNKIDAEKLEALLRDNDYRVVLQEKVGPYFISTIWMGVPHGCAAPYDYFETIIFLTPPNVKDPRLFLGKQMDCYRYHRMEEAVMGHYDVINEWKEIPPSQEDLDYVATMKNYQNIREAIDDHIKITDEWIEEGKFNCQAEMVYAQNIKAINELYKGRRSEEELESDDGPRAS